MRFIRYCGVVVCAVALSTVSTKTAGNQPVSIQERTRGAQRVVVATVSDVSARYERNQYGDLLIITTAQLTVEEALKGDASPATVAIEGGTVNGVTLAVSDLPTVQGGERGIFFLSRAADGRFEPHGRGDGIMKLNRENRVEGSDLSLGEIRQLARAAGK